MTNPQGGDNLPGGPILPASTHSCDALEQVRADLWAVMVHILKALRNKHLRDARRRQRRIVQEMARLLLSD